MARIEITGVSNNGAAFLCGEIARKNQGRLLVVAPSYVDAKRVGTDLSFFVERRIMVVPAERVAVINYEARNKEGSNEKLRILREASEDPGSVTVVPVSETIKKLPPADFFSKNKLDIHMGGKADIRELAMRIAEMGYEREATVYAPGQFSLRGDILDVFTPYDPLPFRVDFFGDEPESIKTFEPETQRSLDRTDGFTLYPAALTPQDVPSYMESFLENVYEDSSYIWEFLSCDDIVILDPKRCKENAEAICEKERNALDEEIRAERIEGEKISKIREPRYFDRIYEGKNVWELTPFEMRDSIAGKPDEVREVKFSVPLAYNGKIDILEKDLRSYKEKGYKVIIGCSTEDRYYNMRTLVDDLGLYPDIELKKGALSAGVEIPEKKLCYISDADIFGRKEKTYRGRRRDRTGAPIQNFTDIKVGDYVVHENHGIGVYKGIEQLTAAGITGDYLKVEYGGNDMLYVPVSQLDLIQKYVGSEGIKPRVNRLSGNEWKKTKARAKAAVAEMANELIEAIAERQARPGFAFSRDSLWQKEFEEKFPYEETPDQLRCVEEIKNDMERPWPMDRLLCGDVGYGKTEVAARAVFKAVENDKQVAILVPTTLLANQHYKNFKERFASFPFKVEMLSRYRNGKQQAEICRDVANGVIDILIGTHRMLSDDVDFKALGLLVVDEEQRFGVSHKEKIKRMKTGVDVLTLSATPIPRTLHMSLVGMREMSIIEEPPEGRYPVQTYVMEQDSMLIRDAIEREMDRRGQVYVVYNRINGINRVAQRIKELVPETRVAVGHGRMNETEMENVMLDFVEGKTDVLVSTTIIESGIDIPNVNTLIVLDADRYGLSQLYQLRGRVGRSDRLAYAYLMYKKEKALTPVAEKRLRAIKDFTEFGAGFKVAMRDLEIRGAGNILGAEQSGHMVNVGYELYCKMVDEAVRRLRGETVRTRDVETAVDLKIEAYIPDSYIDDGVLKMEMYKKTASVDGEEAAVELRAELNDRFGDIPGEVDNLIEISIIRSLGEDLSIARIGRSGRMVILDYGIKGQRPVKVEISEGNMLADTKEILNMLKAGKNML